MLCTDLKECRDKLLSSVLRGINTQGIFSIQYTCASKRKYQAHTLFRFRTRARRRGARLATPRSHQTRPRCLVWDTTTRGGLRNVGTTSDTYVCGNVDIVTRSGMANQIAGWNITRRRRFYLARTRGTSFHVTQNPRRAIPLYPYCTLPAVSR